MSHSDDRHAVQSDDIGELIRLVRHRPSPPAASAARVRAAVDAAWRETLPRARRSRRWFLGLTAALASIAIVLLARAVWRPAAVPAAPLATAVRVMGPARVVGTNVTRDISPGERLVAGTRIATGPGGAIAFELDTGAALRLDGDSNLTIESSARLGLDRGRLYVSSSGSGGAGRALVVGTALGLVREIGTQFEVSAESSALRVRVRRGSIQIDRPDAAIVAAEGEALRVDLSGRVDRTAIAVEGDAWAWIDALAPPIAIEGATLERFMAWVSRELDVRWQYADAAAERHGRTVVLHGSIEGLTPREALAAVLATCGMSQSRRGEQLFIGLARE